MKGLLVVLVALLLVVPAASAQVLGGPPTLYTPPTDGPTGLHGFVGRTNEAVPADHSYTDMPAFAWNPVRGAAGYEIQLATSRTFTDSTMLTDDSSVQAPVTSLQVQVPWMTGVPYALWVRVRATVGSHVTRWSAPWGFNTSWQTVPTQLTAPRGLVRWNPVQGATGYEVWFTDIGVRIRTLTNVADEREYWTLHPALARNVHWRVRALRYVANTALPNKIPVITYGPYSPTYTSTNDTSLSNSPLVGTDAISDYDTKTDVSPKRANALTPAFAWSGTTVHGLRSNQNLWRVYVFSDKACINTVMVGSIVGGPAWAPRWSNPLELPTSTSGFSTFSTDPPLYGAQASAQMPDGTKIVTAEEVAGTSSGATSSSTSSSSPSGSSAGDPSFTTDPGSIALPDNGWPEGRYWWTVVPVEAVVTGNAIVYQDAELPQDACKASGLWPASVWSFGMQSEPVTTTRSGPLASGLHGGRVVAAANRQPAFDRLPVVTWKPVYGAQTYEIQLSRKLYPWKAAILQKAVVPSATLKLTKQDVGLWYYRVRGVNANLPGSAIDMTWSAPTAIRISGDLFTVVK